MTEIKVPRDAGNSTARWMIARTINKVTAFLREWRDDGLHVTTTDQSRALGYRSLERAHAVFDELQLGPQWRIIEGRS